MSLWKRLEVVPFEKVKDALAEQRGYETDVIPVVKVLDQGDTFATERRRV
jgi:hypothetical protein